MASSHWYGGGEAYDQHWPIDQDVRPEKAFVTGDFFQTNFGGLMEPYWLNSDGFAIHADRDLPLFSSFNDSRDGRLCLTSRYAPPYKTSGGALPLGYHICSSSDVKAVHLVAASTFWSTPRAIPDERMLTHPIWSTWASYKTLINQNRTLNFGSEIRQHGFNDSQLEIDDRWESCYGELQFMSTKFPDPVAMINQLKSEVSRLIFH